MADFVSLQEELDPVAAEEAITEAIQERFPDWIPAEGNLEVWQNRAIARILANLSSLASRMGEEALRGWGETMEGVAPIAASPATADSTWTFGDTDGHTISPGTQVTVARTATESYAFEVANEVVVAPGSAATAAGAVQLVAVLPGADANGLTGTATLADAIPGDPAIVLTGPTSGGVDDEDPSDYMARLLADLQLKSELLVIPRDFEADALNVPGVARSLAVPGLNPDDSSTGNPLMVAVFVADANGDALSSGVKNTLKARQEAKLPLNTVVKIGDPTHNAVKVSASFTVLAGSTPSGVEDAVEAAIADYLQPWNWGRPSDGEHGGDWVQSAAVRRFELVSLVDRVPGVDYVTALTLALQAGSLGTSDVTLTGLAPLTTPGTITATAV